MRSAYKFLVGNLKEKDQLGNLGVDGRIRRVLLNFILKKQVMKAQNRIRWWAV
jgi:hypothetical protein